MKNYSTFLSAVKSSGPIFTPLCDHKTGCGNTRTAPAHKEETA